MATAISIAVPQGVQEQNGGAGRFHGAGMRELCFHHWIPACVFCSGVVADVHPLQTSIYRDV